MLIYSAIIVGFALLIATHYATYMVAKRRGWNAANEEEVTLFKDDLNQYNHLLERVLNNVEDLLTIIDGVYADANFKQFLLSGDPFGYDEPDPSQYEDSYNWHEEVPNV